MKLGQKLGFIAFWSLWNHIFDPDTWFGALNEGKWSTVIHYPHFVCRKPIKPMKTHLKTHKIGPKIGFSHNFKLLNLDFGSRHMDLGVGWWQPVLVVTLSTVCTHKTHKTHQNPSKPTKKPIKLGNLFLFFHDFRSPNSYFGPRLRYLGIGWWPLIQLVTLATVCTHKTHKTRQNPSKPTKIFFCFFTILGPQTPILGPGSGIWG